MLTYLKKFQKATVITAVATLACLIVTIIMSANFIRYRTEKKVNVYATVTSIEYYDRSSGDTQDTGYMVYGSYTYGGKDYENIVIDDTAAAPDYSEGDTVKVLVFANDPGTVANNTAPNAVFFLAATVLLAVLSVRDIKKDLKNA